MTLYNHISSKFKFSVAKMATPLPQGNPVTQTVSTLQSPSKHSQIRTESNYDSVAGVKEFIWSLKESLATDGQLPYTNAGPEVNCIPQPYKSEERIEDSQLVATHRVTRSSCDKLSSVTSDQRTTRANSNRRLKTNATNQLPKNKTNQLLTPDNANLQLTADNRQGLVTNYNEQSSSSSDEEQSTSSSDEEESASGNDEKPSNLPSACFLDSGRRVKIKDLSELFHKNNAVAFCQKYNLVAKKVRCRCGEPMTLKPRLELVDNVVWRCPRRHGCRSLRNGTWFERSRLSIPDILYLSYLWVYSCSFSFMLHETGNARNTITSWCKSCRDVCFGILEYHSQPVGGPGQMVEITDSAVGLEKFDGHRIETQPLLIGIEEITNNCFASILPEWEQHGLMSLLKNYILPGTILFSDCWHNFKCLGRKGFKYLLLKHKVQFYDKKKQSYMNSVNDVWNKVMHSKPLSSDRKREYIVEQVYRRTLDRSPDPYMHFLADVSELHKPIENYARNSMIEEK